MSGLADALRDSYRAKSAERDRYSDARESQARDQKLADALNKRHTLRRAPTAAELAAARLQDLDHGARGAVIQERDFRVGGITANLAPMESGNGFVMTVQLPNGDWEDVIVRNRNGKIHVAHG